jgi:hypothetical protein
VGNVSDSMHSPASWLDQSSAAFTTKDRDNDRDHWRNCAEGRGGWW